jgi:tRNA uridine 5-carbamoylmethylation protein Kti12
MDSKALQYLLVIRIAQICYYRAQMVPLYVVELTTGYETNLKNNVKRKKDKYRELLRRLGKNFNQVKFINLSISSLGIFAEECSTFLDIC